MDFMYHFLFRYLTEPDQINISTQPLYIVSSWTKFSELNSAQQRSAAPPCCTCREIPVFSRLICLLLIKCVVLGKQDNRSQRINAKTQI